MNEIAITANKRTVSGKHVAQIRATGKLPAVLYGHAVDNQQIEINEKDFSKAFKQAGESTIVNLVLDGKTTQVLIHEVQNHYLHGQPIHVDFYAVDMSQKIKVKVPLHFIGESAAVKTLGGTLVKNLLEVEIECLPADLPHSIEIDISTLNTFEDTIRVSNLQVSDKVTILASLDEVAVTVSPPRSEEEMKALEEAPVAEDVSKVEGVVKPTDTAAVPADDGKPVKEEKPEKSTKGGSTPGGKE